MKERHPGIPQAADLRMDGQIGSDWFVEGITSAWVRDELSKRTGDLTVWLNSPGGQVIEGSGIYTALREYPGFVTIKVDGLAASAASVIAMAADELCMSPTSYLMIHRASTWTGGNEGDLDEAARQLRAIDEGIVTAYQLKTGMSRAKLLDMMRDETWIPARDAVRMGFADKMLYRDNDQQEEEEEEDRERGGQQLRAVACARPMVYASGVKHSWKVPEDIHLADIFLPRAEEAQGETEPDQGPTAPEAAHQNDDTTAQDGLEAALAVMRYHQINAAALTD